MRHFKLPLIVTGIAFSLALIVGLALVTKIHREKIGDRRKIARVQQLGQGLALMTCLVIAPFWLLAAAKVGKARRQAREAGQTPPNQME